MIFTCHMSAEERKFSTENNSNLRVTANLPVLDFLHGIALSSLFSLTRRGSWTLEMGRKLKVSTENPNKKGKKKVLKRQGAPEFIGKAKIGKFFLVNISPSQYLRSLNEYFVATARIIHLT